MRKERGRWKERKKEWTRRRIKRMMRFNRNRVSFISQTLII
jgi:hypothetical protein